MIRKQWNQRLRFFAVLLFIILVGLIKSLLIIWGLILTLMIYIFCIEYIDIKFFLKRLIKFSVLLLFIFLTLILGNGFNISNSSFIFAFLIISRVILSFCSIQILIAGKSTLEYIDSLVELGIPHKLVSVIYLNNRYIYLFKQHLSKQQDALRSKGFYFGRGLKSAKNMGYVIGSLFIKASDRSNIIYDAMKSRGFRDNYYNLRLIKKEKINKIDIIKFILFLIFICFIFIIDIYIRQENI